MLHFSRIALKIFCAFLPFCILLVCAPCGASAQAQAQNPLERKNVLVLYSEDKAHPAHELVDRGIRLAFHSNKLFDVQVYNEYLDVSRIKGAGYAHAFTDYVRYKFAGIKIDIIITVYPAALDFFLKEASDVFPEIPMVAQVTRAYAENLEHSPRRRFITGTIMGDNITGLLDAAFRMRPSTKRVALVGGTSPNDIYTEQLFRKGLEPYLEKLEIVDLTRLPMQEILTRVGSLPRDTIVLFSNMFTDGSEQNFVPREALALISRAANAPVFGLFDSYLGYGIVGGRLASFEKLGREDAALALRIMGGESPASIPFDLERAYIDLYDWRELRRWNLSESALPKGSIVVNREFTFWDLKYYIIGALAFIMAQSFLLAGLLVQKRRRRSAEVEAQQHREELAHMTRIATMGELTTSLAHEINQPLTAILSNAEAAKRFLSRSAPDINEVQQILEDIVRDDRRASDVVRKVRALVRKEKPNEEILDLNKTIQEVVGLIRGDSLLQGLSITMELSPELKMIRGDRVQLQQVILNLILNSAAAMRNSPQARRKIIVRTAMVDSATVKASVTDFGAGIDEDNTELLFEPFYTTKPDGLGMGLSISQRIVKAHGGTLEASNNPEGGATFAFTLPAHQGDPDL